jgi:hypothetical protein
MSAELETLLDKDLRDDMLKLVRYKILFVKREFEVAFPEQEDLVSDNMDGSAFTAWKVAEFIQELHLDKEKEKNDPAAYKDHIRIPGKWREKHYPSDSYHHKDYLTGLPEGDKKYLRVYFEVLDRYPREKFKYEEQQIRVLEQIRDKMPAQAAPPAPPAPVTPTASAAVPAGPPSPAAPPPDPYSVFLNYLQLSSDVFQQWRADIKKNADSLGESLAAIINAYTATGKDKQFTAPTIDKKDLTAAFAKDNPPFDKATFDRFTGKTKDQMIIYAPNGLPPTTEAPPGHSWWSKTVEKNGSFFQKITGSNYYHVNPLDTPTILTAMAQTQVDLLYNVYTPELGITTWSMYRENHDSMLRSIGYELGGKLFWLNEMLNPDMTRTLGDLPNVVPTQNVDKNQYIISIDFPLKEGSNTYFCVYAMHVEIDFKKGKATFANRILELKAQKIG